MSRYSSIDDSSSRRAHEVILAAHQPAEQRREPMDHHPRGFGLRSDERRDRGQRVEQEVRVDLVRQRREPRRHQQLLLFLQPMLDARVVPDLDRRRDAQHRGEHDERRGRARSWAPGRTGGARRSGARAAGGAARARRARAAARPASPPRSAGTAASRRRGRLEKTNGEKCQMASFGHNSRNPPPAKPQPTANGRAMNSPAKSAGSATAAPTMAPAYGPPMSPTRKAPSSVRSAAS